MARPNYIPQRYQGCILLCFLVLINSVNTVYSQPCPPCRCSLKYSRGVRQNIANCSFISLNQVPSNLPLDLDVLDASNSSIKSVAKYQLQRYHSLTTLILENNDITTVPEDVFYGNLMLKEININGNPIGYLPPKMFQPLTKLRTLSMQSMQNVVAKEILQNMTLNKIEINVPMARTLPRDFFHNCNVSLKEIRITGAKIENLDEYMFENLTILRTVYLDLENVHELPSHIFHGPTFYKLQLNSTSNKNMEGSDAVYNSIVDAMKLHQSYIKDVTLKGIKHIQDDLFCHLHGLEKVSLHGVESINTNAFNSPGNRIDYLRISEAGFDTFMQNLFMSLNLKALVITHCKLTDINVNDLPNMPMLEHLDLSYNQISSIHPEAFDSFRESLEYLDLSHNQVCYLSPMIFKSMWSLETLKLDNNCLHTISNEMFYDLTFLKNLHLQRNRISTLEPYVFSELYDLEFLNISDNKLDRLPSELFQNTQSLQSLDLRGNTLQYFYDNFLPHKDSLKSLYLDQNYLTCDCGVVDIIVAIEINVKVTGVCEQPPGLKGQNINRLTIEDVCPHTTVAETTIAETTVSKSTIPVTTVSEPTTTTTTVAETTTSYTTVAETTIADMTVAEKMIADTTAAKLTIANTIVSETTIADTIAARSTIADTTVPESTIADTTMSEPTTTDTTVAETTIADTTFAETTVAATVVVDNNIAKASTDIDHNLANRTATVNITTVDGGTKNIDITVESYVDNKIQTTPNSFSTSRFIISRKSQLDEDRGDNVPMSNNLYGDSNKLGEREDSTESSSANEQTVFEINGPDRADVEKNFGEDNLETINNAEQTENVRSTTELNVISHKSPHESVKTTVIYTTTVQTSTISKEKTINRSSYNKTKYLESLDQIKRFFSEKNVIRLGMLLGLQANTHKKHAKSMAAIREEDGSGDTGEGVDGGGATKKLQIVYIFTTVSSVGFVVVLTGYIKRRITGQIFARSYTVNPA